MIGINHAVAEPADLVQIIGGDLDGLVLVHRAAAYRLTAGVEPKTDLFQVVGRSPLLVPEGCRTAAAETIARANYGLRLGKFELDLDDGEVRFQVSQILVDDAVGQAVLDRMIGTTVNMLDTYLTALLSVIYADELPKEAIARVEAGSVGRDLYTNEG